VDDVVQEAAQVIGPLLSAGAGAVAHDLAERAGSRFSAATLDILARIRHRLTGAQPDVRTIEKALRAAIADGDVTETELRTFVNQVSGDNVSMHAGKNIYNVRDGINVHGDFHG
jgi:phage terminase Nu1 subunit (DNA packaging protein)